MELKSLCNTLSAFKGQNILVSLNKFSKIAVAAWMKCTITPQNTSDLGCNPTEMDSGGRVRRGFVELLHNSSRHSKTCAWLFRHKGNVQRCQTTDKKADVMGCGLTERFCKHSPVQPHTVSCHAPGQVFSSHFQVVSVSALLELFFLNPMVKTFFSGFTAAGDLKPRSVVSKLRERRWFKVKSEELGHSLFMLSCQHTLNVKGLVWQSEPPGFGWIIDTHSMRLVLFLLFLWLCIACGRSLPQ